MTLDRKLSGLFVFIFTFFAGIPLSAAPRDELLRLVPEDATFTFVVQNLAEKTKALKDAPFFKKLAEVPLGKLIKDVGNPDETQYVLDLFKDLNISPEQFVFEIFGDAIVYSYREGDPEKKIEPQGLFLVNAPNPKLLVPLMGRIDDLSRKIGDLKDVVERKHGKIVYHQRQKSRAEDADEFYWIDGSILAFATDEKMLLDAIDRHQAEGNRESPLSRKFTELGVDKSLIVWWLNPRHFDRDLTAMSKESQGLEKGILNGFLGIWKAFDGIVIHFDINQSIELGVAVSAKKELLPKTALPFFSEFGKPSALWQVIPENALLAIAARMEGTSLIDFASTFIAVAEREQISSALTDLFRVFRPDQLRALPKGLGPDLGFWVFDPLVDPKKKIWCPQMILAIKVRDGSDGLLASDTLTTGMTLVGTMVRFLNGNIALVTSKDDPDAITYLAYDRGFPPGFRPAFGSKGGYFLIAAAPETIKNFTPPKIANPKEATEVPLLRVSFVGWKKYLGEHKDSLSQFFSQGNESLQKEIKSQLDQFVENLELVEKFELVQRSKGETVGLIVRIKPNHALQK